MNKKPLPDLDQAMERLKHLNRISRKVLTENPYKGIPSTDG
jgi:hypothetical protein